MLEPDASKGARPVLRGGGGGDLTSLPDPTGDRMMPEEQRRVHCHEHGERLPTFVCRHLLRGAGLGFYEPNRDIPHRRQAG